MHDTTPQIWLTARATRGSLIGGGAVLLIAEPFILAMSLVLIAMLIYALPQLHIYALIPTLLVALVLAAAMVFVNAMLICYTVTIVRCLRTGRTVLRADDRQVSILHWATGRWDSLPWAQVGSIFISHQHHLLVEHPDPEAWLRRKSLLRRLWTRRLWKTTGARPALICGFELEEPVEETARKLAALREAKHAGVQLAPS